MTATIDVSLLPPPEAIRGLSYTAIKAERLASLTARFAAAGLPYDAAALEGDAAVVLQEEDAWRELLDKAAINDAVRAVLPAYATGANLDAIAARANVERLVLAPADPVTGAAAVRESDAALLSRYLASFAAPAAGSVSGYVSRALTAWPAARDVHVYRSAIAGAPRVNVVVLAAGATPAPAAAVAAIHARLHEPDAAPLTDAVSVRAATLVPWSYRARIAVRPGPDPAVVIEGARAALLRFGEERYRIAAEVPANAPASALYGPNVIRVTPLDDPFPGVPAAPDAAPYLAGVVLEQEIAS